MWAIAVPLIVFVVVVGPVWVVFHYITLWKRMKAEQQKSSPEQVAKEKEIVAMLKGRAERLENRVETLERLLDAEVAEWRNRI
ncbi:MULTISPECIES: envelope stress response membrane protein PspB [Thalassospira]|jgi:phage shock protein B|uniref:Phage shock protein B n=2 Tax=Thalassospira TaxID=168934 RepID=A0A285T853_9PROT|nr:MULTISPECIES: envelope stress response membrane protein PspB [Thalassospira]MBO9506542.1 envelope stress response membrane protein PspB [Thalassospira sp. A3_1]MCK2168085.1 envelope stress response membrane protein PspB [Thalassospira xiamenensis]RCK04726.1 phage-shock protein [Thalassospira xianhensis MCCC 1A02616]WOI12141.1 envelope stress response membrane protein PspB [Thalassospira lucentensis]SOC15713.1 phage shock protein B [Thalassospira xiamenensis]